MNKLYIASTNPNKVKATKDVFTDFEIESIQVTNNTSQPKSIEDTLECAYLRTKSLGENKMRLGLEAGVTLINDKCFLVNFGVLIDENGNKYEAGGTLIPLPEIVKIKIYEDNLELKDAIQALVDDKEINIHNGTIGYLTNDYVTRYDIFYEICKLLKGQYEKGGIK